MYYEQNIRTYFTVIYKIFIIGRERISVSDILIVSYINIFHDISDY